LIEENLWRAIRHGLSGELIDLETGETRPARAHLDRLLEWIQPAAEEIGAAPYLTIPTANAAERQRATHEAGATLEEIYAEQVKTGVSAPLAVPLSGGSGFARGSVGNDQSTHRRSEKGG
jgi:gamma-glutamyl:cysteine ligase YbdK (ATP-grasp superfamily)